MWHKNPLTRKNHEALTMAAKKATKKKTAKKAAAKAPAKKAAAKTSTKDSTAKAPTKKAAAVKKSSAKKAPAAPAKSKLGKKFIDAQKTLLLSERERYVKSAATWKAEADSLVESREPGDVQFDEESGEGDSLAVERERDLVLSANAKAAVEQIDEALLRIENGTYGICVGSGQPIPKERLEAIPWAAERVEYKAAGFARR